MCSSGSLGLQFGVAECGAFWVNDLLWRMDLVYERDHGSRKLGEQLTANMSMRPSEYFDRNCFIGASNIVRVELARRYEIGVGEPLLGQRLPAPRGHLAAHPRVPRRGVLRHPRATRPRRSSAPTPPRSTASTPRPSQPLADRIGPTPDDLGQRGDPTAEVGRRQARRPALVDRHRDLADRDAVTEADDRQSARFDPLDPAFTASPFEQYAALRDDDPVHRSELL